MKEAVRSLSYLKTKTKIFKVNFSLTPFTFFQVKGAAMGTRMGPS